MDSIYNCIYTYSYIIIINDDDDDDYDDDRNMEMGNLQKHSVFDPGKLSNKNLVDFPARHGTDYRMVNQPWCFSFEIYWDWFLTNNFFEDIWWYKTGFGRFWLKRMKLPPMYGGFINDDQRSLSLR